MCNHSSIEPFTDGEESGWACTSCHMLFIPAVDVPDLSTTLDAIAGTMSAVLFDYTERIAERYGLRPDAVRTDDTDKHDCEAEGHDRNVAGICIKCGDNPFLGN